MATQRKGRAVVKANVEGVLPGMLIHNSAGDAGTYVSGFVPNGSTEVLTAQYLRKGADGYHYMLGDTEVTIDNWHGGNGLSTACRQLLAAAGYKQALKPAADASRKAGPVTSRKATAPDARLSALEAGMGTLAQGLAAILDRLDK